MKGFPAARTPGARAVLPLALLLLAAAGAQGTWVSPRSLLSPGGGQPDLVFTIALAGALLSDPGGGALLGFGGGLLSAALAGETVGTILVSQTLAGYLAGWFSARLFRANAGVILLCIFAASLFSHALFVLSAPGIGLRRGADALLVGSAANALLGIPATFLLRRLGWGRNRV